MALDSRYTLQHQDLKDLIVPKISIDEFNPKTGEAQDVIVSAFYLQDKEPAQDLSEFIETSKYETLDVECSPNPDDDGNYLVFVEMMRDENFLDNLKGIAEDISNLVGDNSYDVKSYFAEESFKLSDPALSNFVIQDPNKYMTKEEFAQTQEEIKVEQQKLDMVDFLKDSYIDKLGIHNQLIEFTSRTGKQKFEVLNFGKEMLDEFANNPIQVNSMEDNKLQFDLGKQWAVNKLSTDVVTLSKNGSDKILTLKRI